MLVPARRPRRQQGVPVLLRQPAETQAVNNLSDHSLFPPPPERFNVARYCLAAHAAARPDKTALIVVGGGQERRWCYGELDRAVRRLAGGFRRLGLAQRAGR